MVKKNNSKQNEEIVSEQTVSEQKQKSTSSENINNIDSAKEEGKDNQDNNIDSAKEEGKDNQDNNIDSAKEDAGITEEPPKDTYPEGTQMYKIKAKSETGLKTYYRKGLKFTPSLHEYEVSKEVYDSLKKDNHLTIID
ncbi:hypothetical protein WESB_0328 [Brachyspira pilosicoli WesB]|uniref:Uncharacterized protein n=1 Tax=Brachyspira pilosicoli WesB TaxID=1161918 RepID=K0JGA9_BRAPL|nr:hypothetical protein [Brachyspira pilosicoli]CCG55799.1 hypothetical protein WESB_0328 [Brachyspira pilosicoli WesB]